MRNCQASRCSTLKSHFGKRSMSFAFGLIFFIISLRRPGNSRQLFLLISWTKFPSSSFPSFLLHPPHTFFWTRGLFFLFFQLATESPSVLFSLKFLLANFLNLRKSKLPIFGLTVFFRLFGFWKLFFFLCFQAARFFSLIVRFAYIQRTTLCFFFFHITYFFSFFFFKGE